MEHLQQILIRCKDFDSNAQRIVYEHYRGWALKTVFRYIYRYDEAIDVVTDGFVKVFAHFERFTESTDPDHLERVLMGWIKRIMINTAIDHLRRKSLLPEIGALPAHIWETDSGQLSSDQLEYKELMEMVRQLPPSNRIVFNLHVIDGYSHHEISQMMDIPIGTSKSHLLRARHTLQNKIKDATGIKHVSAR